MVDKTSEEGFIYQLFDIQRGRWVEYDKSYYEYWLIRDPARARKIASSSTAKGGYTVEALCAALNFVSWFTTGNSVQRDPVYLARMHGAELTAEAMELRDKLQLALASQSKGQP